jgi:pantoate--beta-alanine ligase
MTTVESIGDWQAARAQLRDAGRTLGFVPTMGALHDGHLSLVQRSRHDNDCTLVSIFVNPAQFNDPADLRAYPRPLSDDLHWLRDAGVDFVLVPREAEMYADGYRYRVVEAEESRTREGLHRPGHFDGVLTVVMKLLNIATADRAYFGEKDWQQLQLVQGLARAFFLPTTIVGCPTVRDYDGLALSSRNARLSAQDRATAALFHRALVSAPSAEAAREMLHTRGFTVDYVEDVGARRLGAVTLSGVRLIDNVSLEEPRR